MNQQNLTFLPHVLPIPLGATVVFPNNDQVDHNVFSLSKPKNFNLGTYGPGGAKSVIFNKPGLVQLRCDMHAEMSAYILVMKNGYFGLTDRKGRFTIPDNNYRKKLGLNPLKELPPGSYKVRTWHEKLRNSKKSVVVKNSESLMLNLKLKRGAPGVLYKK
jgi:hypothetical protein